MSRRLFKVTLRALEEHWVVAADAHAAYEAVRSFCDRNDRWTYDKRALKTVELIAEQNDYPECGTRLHIQ
jgi:hypothetical protein